MLRASRAIFTFFLLICVFSCGVTASYGQSFKWNPIKHNGHEYVSLNSVKAFYGFNKMNFRGKSITLENKGVKLQLGAGSQQCQYQRVRQWCRRTRWRYRQQAGRYRVDGMGEQRFRSSYPSLPVRRRPGQRSAANSYRGAAWHHRLYTF